MNHIVCDCFRNLLRALLIHYPLGTSKKEQEEAIRKAVDCSTTASQTVDWSRLPCEGRFWERKLAPAKPHYL